MVFSQIHNVSSRGCSNVSRPSTNVLEIDRSVLSDSVIRLGKKNGQMRFHQRGDPGGDKHEINPRLTPVEESVSVVAAVVPLST